MRLVNSSHNVLLLITSPFQYWCAKEYLHQNNLANSTLTIVNAGTFCENSMRQIKLMHDDVTLREEIILDIPRHGDLASRISPYAEIINGLALQHFDVILLGDLRQIWMQDVACSVACDNVVLVDDGAATNVFEKYLIAPNGYTLPIPMHVQNASRKSEAQAIKRSLGITDNQKPFSLFSVFSFNNQERAKRNTLSLMKAQFENSQAQYRNECHFIGSPVCEKGIMTRRHYDDVLRDAASQTNQGEALVYFAHRAENLEQKESELNSLGFSIECYDEPYELVCAGQSRIPRRIAGLHSTTLFNLKKIFGSSVNATCYKINDVHLKKLGEVNWGSDTFTLRDHVESIYARLDEFGITSRYANNEG